MKNLTIPQNKQFPYYRLLGSLGNLLEHYDNALFGLLAPFIAPLFFEGKDAVTALILTYGMIPLGILSRPLGSLFFGWIGDCFGRKQALFFALLGMAFATVGIGSLPLYQDVGIFAPIFLALGRMLQSFCTAGESTGGAIFVLEHTQPEKRGLISSLYDASSICGILIASGLVALLSTYGNIETNWRYLFWGGGITAIAGVILRLLSNESNLCTSVKKKPSKSCLSILKEHKNPLFSIILASGFSYTTYSMAFTLMNGYVPLITSIAKTDVMHINTSLLFLDMLFLPFFGFLANRFGKEKIMFFGAASSVLGALPLFFALGNASLLTVIMVRLAIMIPGVAFAAPYHAWAIEQVPSNHRYLIMAFGCSLGAQLIGAPTAAACIWLYKITGWSAAPGLYLMVAGIGAGFTLQRKAEIPITA